MILRAGAASLIVTLLIGCGQAPVKDEQPAASSQPSAEPSAVPPPPATTAAPKPGTTIVASTSEFGPMLFDKSGQAIYVFDLEATSMPRCYDDCAEAWPPVLAKGKPVAGRGVDALLLGTTKRADGTKQVTYNGHPLYYYAHEGKGEVKCHDVFLNGGSWYVIQPGGDPAPGA